jgi:hypothetical protein
MREDKRVHVGKNTGLPKERLEGCAHLNGDFFNAKSGGSGFVRRWSGLLHCRHPAALS